MSHSKRLLISSISQPTSSRLCQRIRRWPLPAYFPSPAPHIQQLRFRHRCRPMHGASVTLRCQNGALNEVWYHFDVRGSVQTGQFVAAEPTGATSKCPTTGIKYLPKSRSAVPSGSSTTTITTTRNYVPSPTGTPFEGLCSNSPLFGVRRFCTAVGRLPAIEGSTARHHTRTVCSVIQPP